MADREPCTYRDVIEVIYALPIALREARRARGIAGNEAARQMGLHPKTISRVEAGDNTTREVMVTVLRWLDQTGAIQ